MGDTGTFCNQTANLTDPACLNSTRPSYSHIDITTFMHIFPTIYGILCSVGVIANGLVIYAVAACKKKMVSDIYVLNLAIADMLFLLVMPFNIHQLVRDRQWVFGNFMCKAVVVDVSNQFTTVGIVTVLCIDRYIAIVHPTSEKRTIHWTIMINILVWLGSFLLTVPVMMYAKVERRQRLEVCMMNLDGPEDMYWYTFYQSILGYIIPFIIISTFYSLTLYHVFSSIRRVKRKQSVWAKRATKMVLMVIALFLICWSPYHVIQVINLSNNTPTITFVYAYHISICLSYSHSCINPLMLLIFAQNYRDRLCRRNMLNSSQHSSKLTVVKTDGSSITNNPNYRCTVV
uniref:Melanin-concentrating hormone receptor 2 n=1 Tax=Paralichthys olivaceus TaxID=8255 RepID=B7T8C9_PAROL|nr:melanin-concentrating hormone receptor 2 [Paralichthys olivaceus]ACJ45805.1 melanin-concentrating hormone receptor 2 [Paralichthys olivaceus]AKO69804.1 melanin-concentrating hormone receptor 2 [Paralichthys olivaceus]AKO69806.1 melanin-concentrating hormone receptor 2 [Paralichthys olivaceus]